MEATKVSFSCWFILDKHNSYKICRTPQVPVRPYAAVSLLSASIISFHTHFWSSRKASLAKWVSAFLIPLITARSAGMWWFCWNCGADMTNKLALENSIYWFLPQLHQVVLCIGYESDPMTNSLFAPIRSESRLKLCCLIRLSDAILFSNPSHIIREWFSSFCSSIAPAVHLVFLR